MPFGLTGARAYSGVTAGSTLAALRAGRKAATGCPNHIALGTHHTRSGLRIHQVHRRLQISGARIVRIGAAPSGCAGPRENAHRSGARFSLITATGCVSARSSGIFRALFIRRDPPIAKRLSLGVEDATKVVVDRLAQSGGGEARALHRRLAAIRYP